jgi:hypothetical protein
LLDREASSAQPRDELRTGRIVTVNDQYVRRWRGHANMS